MTEEPERIAQLWRNTTRMKEGLHRLGFDLGKSQTPILPLYCRDRVTAFKLCKRLQEEGIFLNPVVSPAVAPGQELIRLSLMATHTDSQIDFALDKLGKTGKEFGLI
jgi:7-keto-8-aminopelargonate synthetase-like enzyme